MAAAVPPTTGSFENNGSRKTAGPLPLTPGRVAALVIGVPVCLVLVGATGFSNLASFAIGSSPAGFTVPATTRALTVNVPGDLVIRQTTAGRVTFTGTARYTFVRSVPTEHTVAGATTIGYGCEVATGECGLNGTLTVPKSVTTLTSNTGAGDVTVTGMTGPVNVSTGDGKVSVSDMSGPLTLNSASGSIQVSDVTSASATLSASSGDGNISATGIRSATFTANTDSGSIDESGTATAVTASSGDGDIKIVFTGAAPHNVNVNTDSGDITIVLPNGSTRYDIAANSGSGSGAVNNYSSLQSKSSRNGITASTGDGIVTIETLSQYRSSQ